MKTERIIVMIKTLSLVVLAILIAGFGLRVKSHKSGSIQRYGFHGLSYAYPIILINTARICRKFVTGNGIRTKNRNRDEY